MVSRWISIAAPAFALWLFQVSLFIRPPSLASRKHTHELVTRAHRALGERRHADALQPLLRLTGAYPRNHVYLHELAQVYEVLRLPGKEVEALEQFVKLSPAPWEACPRLGKAYRELGRHEDSLRAFERC